MAKGMVIGKDGGAMTERDRARIKMFGLLAMLGNAFYEVDRAGSMNQAMGILLNFLETARGEWPGDGVALVNEVWAMGEELGFKIELSEDLPEPVGNQKAAAGTAATEAERAMWH